MGNYLQYLESISSARTARRKQQRAEANFARYLAAGQTVLEVGPGRGEFLGVLERHGIDDVDIIEPDGEVGRHIIAHFPVKRHWFLPLEELSAVDADLRSYDLIVLVQVLEHVRRDKLTEVVRLLYGHLKPGGRLLIVVPNGGNPFGVVELYADLTHVSLFTENSLRQLVEWAGIGDADVEIRGYRVPASSLLNCVRIAVQKVLHLLLLAMLVANTGNVYRTLDPNICLIVRRRPRVESDGPGAQGQG